MSKIERYTLAGRKLFCPIDAEIRKSVHKGTLCKSCKFLLYDCDSVKKETTIVDGYKNITDCAFYEAEIA